MDIPVHNRIIWSACEDVLRTQPAGQRLHGIDPRECFPYLVRGSWINDTNQASLVTDAEPIREADRVPWQKFFNALWVEYFEELIAQMRVHRDSEDIAKAAFERCRHHGLHADQLSQYDRFDHLDVLSEDPDLELNPHVPPQNPANDIDGFPYPGHASAKRSRTLHVAFAEYGFLHGRLFTSTTGSTADRLGWHQLSTLGQALHTLSDFYAHTNYVELLLWSLAERRILDPGLVDTFNHPPFLLPPSTPYEFTPLPVGGVDPYDLAARHQAYLPMWYGASAADTPLVSALFVGRDTVTSLLHMYAAHLRSMRPAKTEQHIDMAMAIFDVPGQQIAKGLWEIYERFDNLLAKIGRLVRKKAAVKLEGWAKKAVGAENQELLAGVAMAMHAYDSDEGREWAKAGRLEYAALELNRQMARKIEKGRPSLPHHSLINKDYLPGSPEERLRFRLACRLAREACAELLRVHFRDGTPDEGRVQTLLDRMCLHPAEQLSQGYLNEAALKQIITRSYGERWSGSSGATAITILEL